MVQSTASRLALGEERRLANETYIANRMVKLIKDITRQPKGQPVMRFNQAKTLGVLSAEFEVLADLPETLAQGMFAAPKRYSAQIRFASASTQDDRKKDLRGASIKVFGVPGEKLFGKEDQQDFLFNSFPVLFAADPESFLKFIEATARNRRWSYFINRESPHWLALQILLMARAHHSSPFDIPYWSTTPYRLGPNVRVAVKYKLTPSSKRQSQVPFFKTKDYLRDHMKSHLESEDVCFDFGVQFQMDPNRMPIEDASKLWSESNSPFHTVAKIRIAKQVAGLDSVWIEDDQIGFNPWQSLVAHQPLGGINRVRQSVYQALAAFRMESC